MHEIEALHVICSELGRMLSGKQWQLKTLLLLTLGSPKSLESDPHSIMQRYAKGQKRMV